jgi:Zn-dependent protease
MFCPPGQLTARQEDNPLTGQTFQANIGPQPDYFPAISPARVRLSQHDHVSYLQVGEHKKIIPPPCYNNFYREQEPLRQAPSENHLLPSCLSNNGTMLNLDPITLISRLITLVIALTVHEFSHAKVADAFGDTTPRMNGRVTLNPLAHLDPIGSLMMIFAGFGWAKPVPVNPFLLGMRSPSAYMLVSLAGPLSNLMLAILAAIPVRLGLVGLLPGQAGLLVYQFLSQFILLNLVLAFFNLIPLAPLDGDKIAGFFFPPSWGRVLERIRPYGPIILMVILFGLPYVGIDLIGTLLYPPIRTVYHLLIG